MASAPLSNSTRSLRKVTHVPLKVPDNDTGRGRAILKSGYVRQLALQPGEVDTVIRQRQSVKTPRLHEQGHDNAEKSQRGGGHDKDRPSQESVWSLLRQFEGTPLASTLPPASAFSDVRPSQLAEFGDALTKVRKARLTQLKQDKQPGEEAKNATGSAAPQEVKPAVVASAEQLALASMLVNSSIAATNAFNVNTGVSPVGMLNLERLEMAPAGIEQGELIATIPLAPKEKTNVVEQEWSVISQEFSTIVTDSLENFSKTGVTENSELAQATSSQNAHSNQFNVTASASGGCGFVSGSVSTNFGSQASDSTSASDSRKHAVATTKEASSRVTQSRKVTISTTATSGSSLTTTRTLENPSDTKPMRIDYFSMMRKWRVGLYRYGLRLTYDLTVPEPGAAMRADFMEIEMLKSEIQQAFTFKESYASINEDTYEDMCIRYGAAIPAAPHKQWDVMSVAGSIDNHGTDGSGSIFTNTTPVLVPDGYQIDGMNLTLELSFQGPNPDHNRRFDVLGCLDDTWIRGPDAKKEFPSLTGLNGLPFLQGRTGNQTITHMSGGFRDGGFQFDISLKRTDAYFKDWKASVWNALYDAAQTKYYTELGSKQARLEALQARVNGVDTLTLRREENDEIMKCVLRWILGTNFEFVPANVVSLFAAAGGNLPYGVNFTGPSVDPNKRALDWTVLYAHEAKVSFINQAIEWENVVFFLYSYFWDVPESWPFIRAIQHPDATRQAFLRAGAARVVLTVRKGYEEAFTWFAEQGDMNMPPTVPSGYPYMTIAQQIRNYDNTNYPGIPPANPKQGPSGGDTPQAATTASVRISPSTAPVAIKVADASDFVVGGIAVIDSWDAGVTDENPTGIQESQMIVAVDIQTNTITVKGMTYVHDGREKDFSVYQTSPKGLLIAEWYEYTPSRGTLISVDSDMKTMA